MSATFQRGRLLVRQYIAVIRQLDSGKVLGVFLLEGRVKSRIAEDARRCAIGIANHGNVEVEYGVYEPLIAPNMIRVYRGVVTMHGLETEEMHHGNVDKQQNAI